MCNSLYNDHVPNHVYEIVKEKDNTWNLRNITKIDDKNIVLKNSINQSNLYKNNFGKSSNASYQKPILNSEGKEHRQIMKEAKKMGVKYTYMMSLMVNLKKKYIKL